MDVKLAKPPLPLNGVHWSSANRWIIGTSAQAFIIAPQFTVAGGIPTKHEVGAAIESTQNIEAVCVLDELPASFPFPNALVLLASDSTIRIFAPKKNPELENWQEVGSGRFERGAEHICSIASVVMAAPRGDAVAVVACGSMSGSVSLVGLGVTDEDADTIGSTSVLKFAACQSAVSYLAWLPDTQHQHLADICVLAVGAADGTVQLWGVTRDLSQASVLATICERDWRPVTAHGVGKDVLIIVKLGQAITIDLRDIHNPTVQNVSLGVTQTIVTCVIDERRDRAYIGTYNFEIIVLGRRAGQWYRATEEETPLREGMKKTIVRSFTTKFNMQRLFLRGMMVSQNGRYLTFVADDQVNWDVLRDGAEITRIHFHQLGDWTLDDSKRVLEQIATGGYRGNLRYNLWDVLDGESADSIGALANYLSKMCTLGSAGERQQWRFMLNLVGSILEDDQYKSLVAEARNQALDHHVKDEDQAYLAQLHWAVHQPAYADIVDQLPAVMDNSSEITEGDYVCSVTLAILKSPGSDQCSTCMAKRKHVDIGHSESLAGTILTKFPQCPFCKGRFYPAAV
ncbi:hypothetical protein GGF49_003205 [Coemansia sp. RSA 1853]|nr:hypothetical protein GGF49_003205 [Coemansia sp. RSA 1853]